MYLNAGKRFSYEATFVQEMKNRSYRQTGMTEIKIFSPPIICMSMKLIVERIIRVLKENGPLNSLEISEKLKSQKQLPGINGHRHYKYNPNKKAISNILRGYDYFIKVCDCWNLKVVPTDQ